MTRVLLLVLVVLVASPARAQARDPFEARGVEGAFVLVDVATGRETVVGALADVAFPPMSTFKIPNTLIGLETGVIPDERFSLRWDGVRRQVDAWNRDQDLASAMRESVVWFYQEVARRIGAERMRRAVASFCYGNRDVSGPIDRFWLDDGSLRITPRQQTAFLRRLARGRLPVSAEHVAILKRITELERTDTHTLYGKTGTGVEGGRAIGWLVGLVERRDQTLAYALLIRRPDANIEQTRAIRRPLLDELLRDHGALGE